jgi:importin subunit beta-1
MEQVFASLGTEKSRPSTAAQCVSRIACIELPRQLWPDVITNLMSNVTNPVSTPHQREASLEALGYICQEIVS